MKPDTVLKGWTDAMLSLVGEGAVLLGLLGGALLTHWGEWWLFWAVAAAVFVRAAYAFARLAFTPDPNKPSKPNTTKAKGDEW